MPGCALIGINVNFIVQARAAMSHVVIAVTHCDQLPKGIRRKEQDRILDAVNKLYAKKSKVYPTIHAVEFVSCYEGKKDFADISKLAHVLYNVAHKVETISSNFNIFTNTVYLSFCL